MVWSHSPTANNSDDEEDDAPRPLFFAEATLHNLSDGYERAVVHQLTALPEQWRWRDRMRTMNAALILCLNIGVDPPDVCSHTLTLTSQITHRLCSC